MKRIFVFSVAAILFMVGGCVGSAEKNRKDDVGEKQNAEQLHDVLFSDKGLPMVVDFSAEWCPPCRQLKPIFHDLGKDYEGKVDFLTVNVDSMPELARQYNVSSIPTLVFISKEGKELHRTVGFRSADEIKADISAHLE